MPKVTIEDTGCRGCTMCVDICPVDVFDFDEAAFIAKSTRPDDCIGCLSCVYVCPSRCVEVADVEMLRPFHRIEKNAALVEKFLQAESMDKAIVPEDWEEAYADVAVRLHALGGAVTETMGRGQKIVGRKSGTLSASHMPEMYEDTDLEVVMAKMKERFEHAFDFDFKVVDGEEGKEVALKFQPCGLGKVVTDKGEKIGEAVLCHLFHEYWAGLVGTFCNAKYKCEMGSVGSTCEMKLTQ